MTAVPLAVLAALEASGLRLLRAAPPRLHLRLGRRVAHEIDLVVVAGAVGAGEAFARTLVLDGPPAAAAEHPAVISVADDDPANDDPVADDDPADGPLSGHLPDGTAWWWLPHDPALPGLPLAVDREHVGGWLGGLGVLRSLEQVAYRPGERAVLATAWEPREDEARPDRTVFLKVLPPEAVHPLHRRLRAALEAGVPVPPLVAPPHLGVLALGRVPGVPWRGLLTGPRADALDPRAVEDVLDRLPAALAAEDPDDVGASGTAGRVPAPDAAAAGTGAWRELLDHATWAAAVLDPATGAQTGRAAGAARTLLDSADPGPVVPVHGDLHPGNLHVGPAGTRVTGLLDADTLGPGHRVDDWAALIGHLRAARADLGAGGTALDGVIARFTRRAGTSADPEALAARTAATLLALAAQPEAPPAAREARRAAAAEVLHGR